MNYPYCQKCASFGHLTSQCPAKEKWVSTETPVVEAVMDSDGDTIDEEIEMKTCDTHKNSGMNREDAINTDQSIQIKHQSAASKDIESKGKSCQDEEMPHIQANKGKNATKMVLVQIAMRKKS